MKLILDVSAAAEVILNRPQAGIIAQQIEQAEVVLSSDLYQIELANVLWKYVRADLLSKELAMKSLQYGIQLVDEFIPMIDYLEEALSESIRLQHSSYDMLYFCLARRTGGKLSTLDAKLTELVQNEGL
jgi:predicted nucleic acid-binding protein